MAEAFEERLYALIAELDETPEFIERFKAKGDGAFLFADLEADPEDLGDSLFALMVEFGVPMPCSDTNPRGGLFSAGYWELREVTVAELKQSVLSGRWPHDAWTYHRRRWWDHVLTAVMLPVSIIAVIGSLPIFLVTGVFWLFRRLSRKSA